MLLMMSDDIASKHVEQPRNKGIITLSYTVAFCWSFHKNCVTMHGTMKVKFTGLRFPKTKILTGRKQL